MGFRKFYIPILNGKVKMSPNTTRTVVLNVYVAIFIDCEDILII